MYVELHCHSHYSLRAGASSPEELVVQARALGYPALALTDHNGLYGAMSFAQCAVRHGLQPIIGAQLTLHEVAPATQRVPGPQAWGVTGLGASSRWQSAPARAGGVGSPRLGGRGATTPQHWGAGGAIVLLAESREGYGYLCRLITEMHLTSPRGDPVLRLREELRGRLHGLIALCGGREGPLARLIEAERWAEAEALGRRLRDLFGRDSFFIELQRHLVYGDERRNRHLRALAERLGVGVVATGDVQYHRRDRHRLHDVLVAVRHLTTLDGCHRERRPNAEFALRAPAEMVERFRDCPEALANTRRIAERCAGFDLTRDLGYRFPDFDDDVSTPGGVASADAVLARVCEEALAVRYAGEPPEVQAEAERRLAEELRLVRHHGLAGFFLVYRDLLELAKEVAAEVRGGRPRGTFDLPPGRGRGSSVSSIICYLIGLSHVCPVKYRFFLGRFLNEALRSVPDIDLDFPRAIREQLILRVYERYGHNHVGLVCTFATYRIRSALRDIGRALALPPAQIDRLSKLSEGGGADTIRAELSRLPEIAPHLPEAPWKHLIELAEALDGCPRHVGQHVGGMVISSRPIVELVPVEPAAMPGRFLLQWDKDSCDDARFIKVDFLALGALGQVEECLDLIVASGKRPVNLAAIDYEDPVVWDMISRADTVGTFQIESRAQQQMLPRTRPRNLAELAVQVAIVRPGPVVGGALAPYVRRAEAARLDPAYTSRADHPLLEAALAETYGVIIFQDQVLQVCQDMAGFTAGEADDLRRALSRRRSRQLVELYWPKFRDGAAAKGVPEATARRVFDQVLGFAEYGFPKAHAAAFAVLAYQTAWLRRYHLPEATAALLNNQPMGFYSIDVLIKDAQRHGLRVRRPCVNASAPGCTVEPPPAQARRPPGAALPPPAAPRSVAHLAGDAGLASVPDPATAPPGEHPVADGHGRARAPGAPAPRREPAGSGPPAGGAAPSLPAVPERAAPRPPTGGGGAAGAGTPQLEVAGMSAPRPPTGGGGAAGPGRPDGGWRVDSTAGVVRLGLRFVAGVGEHGAAAIVAERERAGPFLSLPDFVRRMARAGGLRREGAENLIAVGAFDWTGLGRRRLLWQLGLLLPPGFGGAWDRGTAPTPGVGAVPQPGVGATPAVSCRQLELALPTLQDMVNLVEPREWERMLADYAAMDLSPQWHPMGLLRQHLDRRYATVKRLLRVTDGSYAALAGLVVTRQRPLTAKGFMFLLLEDETGLGNVIVSPRLYARCRSILRTEPFLLVRGRVHRPRRDDHLNLIGIDIRPLRLPDAVAQAGARRAVPLRPLFDRRQWPAIDDPSLPPSLAQSPLGPPPLGLSPEEQRVDQMRVAESGYPAAEDVGADELGLVDQARLVVPPAHNFR